MYEQEKRLDEAFEAGTITEEDYQEELKYLHETHKVAAEEAAQQAYDDEMARW